MFKVKIGLEIHVQLNTKSKLFSNAINAYTDKPNTHVAPLDMAHPGALPRLNEAAVYKAVCAGKVLNCKIHNISKFDRKHYSYSDLPLGYQLTQFYEPICTDGYVALTNKKVRINRIHIEADAGKMLHKNGYYYIDYNRCGAPLLEIVTEPDLSSSQEVVEFLRKIIRDLEYAEVSDCAMERGNLRCDINISLYDDKISSQRVEIKNINSVAFAEQAIEYEIIRQTELLNTGQSYEIHTRSFNNGVTTFMRKKEDSHQYRYFRCGDIPTLRISDEYIANVQIPETYDQKWQKYMEMIQNKEVVSRLLNDKETCLFFERAIEPLYSTVNSPSRIALAANFIACDLMGLCINDAKPYTSKVLSEYITQLANMLFDEQITTRTAKNVLVQCFQSGEQPIALVAKGNLSIIKDEDSIRKLVEQIKQSNTHMYEQFCKGNEKILDALVGKAMVLTNGRVHVDEFKRILLADKKNVL